MTARDSGGMMADIRALQSATLAARARTGDASIGTDVANGEISIVSVTYPTKRGYANVRTIRAGLTLPECVAALNQMVQS